MLNKSWQEKAKNPEEGHFVEMGSNVWSAYLNGAERFQNRLLEELQKLYGTEETHRQYLWNLLLSDMEKIIKDLRPE